MKCALEKTLILCVVFVSLVLAYAQNCIGQYTVKTKGGPIIKALEPRLALEFVKKNRRNPDVVVLDIRTPQEFQDGHIEGAVNIDHRSPTFGADLDKHDKTKTYFVYCRIGRRSGEAIGIITQKGFTSTYRTPGDIVAWTAAGLPLVKEGLNFRESEPTRINMRTFNTEAKKWQTIELSGGRM
jgi:rhodanese-related sulfurtransferase